MRGGVTVRVGVVGRGGKRSGVMVDRDRGVLRRGVDASSSQGWRRSAIAGLNNKLQYEDGGAGKLTESKGLRHTVAERSMRQHYTCLEREWES